MSGPALSTRVDETASGRPGPSLPSIDRVRGAAADVERAARELDTARDGLAGAIRAAVETGHSLRVIARAAGLSHEAVRRYRRRK